VSTEPGNDKDLLAQELQRRSRVMPEHPISVDAVRAEARGIRRRRRIAAGAVAAVVLVIAAPVALSSSGLLDGAPPAPVAPTPSPDPTGEASPEPSPPGPAPTPGPDGRFTLTLEGLDRGPLSAEPVLIGRRLVTPERTVQVPAEVSQILPAGDGWLAAASLPPEGLQTVRLDADLEVVESYGPGTRLAGDAAGSRVAYVRAGGGEVELVDEPVDGSAPATYPLPGADAGPAPVGYAGEAGIVVEETTGDVPGSAAVVAPDGTVRPLDGVQKVWATSSTGLLGAQTSYDSTTGRACSAVMDAQTGDRVVWETCDHTLKAFSSDGRFVAGGASDTDALGSPTVAVLDAQTGEVVVELTTRGRAMGAADQLAWEDGDTLLVSWTEDGRQGIVRVELDGSTELASEVVRTPPMAVSMWFAEIARG
jgi:hypothetical protein